eukprot:m.138012 g.138012  ORF g.138012 m.138012 type:complete len:236 (-) comp17593_c0_seq3:206-913(-)
MEGSNRLLGFHLVVFGLLFIQASGKITSPKFTHLRFSVPKNKEDISTHVYSIPSRVGMRNVTSGTTLGKPNYAAYVAFPDATNTSMVNVLGYQQLYFITPQPTCCKGTLTLAAFRKAFEGTYLFTQIDTTWDKVNATSYEKIGPSHLGYPCRDSEHSEYVMRFTKAPELPASSFSHVVSMTPSGPGGPATCTARKESVDFHRVSSDEHAIAKESKAAYDNIVDKCGKYPNNQCYL